MSEQPALGLWNQLLTTALKMPGVRVDRATFLRSALTGCCSAAQLEQAIQTTPAKAGLSKRAIREAAESSIKWHRAGVTAVSAVTGLPGGWWLAGTIPADLAQYFWHVVVMLQKLAFLHGWPALLENDAEPDDETKLVLTLFVGVMLGAQGATDTLGKLARALSAELSKRLPRAALTKYSLHRLALEVAKWIGLSLTKKKLAELIGRAVPLAGGVVAGSVTWLTFGKGAERLLTHLEGLPLAEA